MSGTKFGGLTDRGVDTMEGRGEHEGLLPCWVRYFLVLSLCAAILMIQVMYLIILY